MFWVEHALWGDTTLGYHLVNLSLHATSALLVATILRRLAIPGAWLAAAIFALHPLQVESAAWISELKNTLSGVFYLGAALLYLRFDRAPCRAPCTHGRGRGRGWRKAAWYLAALALFLMALTSKTVTGTLPGALLVIFWWQCGRLAWKKDVLPLVPFFLLGAGMGMITAWWEIKINNCVGPEFAFTPVERLLIAARGVWFQLGHLLWPANLAFLYPRWKIDSAEWRQYLYPLAAAGLLALLWALRRRSRAPLAAALFFGGTLFPVMGFFNLYTFRYSFVADHYQYLAGLGVIALFSAGMALLLKRTQGWIRPIGWIGCAVLLAGLAVLSWSQSQMYVNLETLYAATIDRNPECWMACNNLGFILAGKGDYAAAIVHYRRAVESKPDYVEAHYNLAAALASCGQLDEAIAHYETALKFEPDYADTHNNLAAALAGRGRLDEAIAHYRRALELKPDHVEAHYNLAVALAGRGQFDEAIDQYQLVLAVKADDPDVRHRLGLAFAGRSQFDEAIAQYRKALELKPDFAVACVDLGVALAGIGQVDAAIAEYAKALEINPNYAEAHNDLANALARRGQVNEAIGHYRKALDIRPDFLEAHANLAAVLSGRGETADAVAHYRKALELATARNDGNLADRLRERIRRLQPAEGAP